MANIGRMGNGTVRIEGLDQTIAALKRLPGALHKGPVRGALFAAASIMKKQAITNAPTGKYTPLPGLLKRSIYIYRDRSPGTNTVRYHVAVRSNRKRGRGTLFGSFTAGAYYWHFVEFGTVKQPAQHYMLRAFLMLGRSSVSVFSRELAKGVASAVARARGGQP